MRNYKTYIYQLKGERNRYRKRYKEIVQYVRSPFPRRTQPGIRAAAAQRQRRQLRARVPFALA